MDYIVGLDIGGTKCAVILAKVGLQIDILDRLSFASLSEKGFSQLWERILKNIRKILQTNFVTEKQLRAIGVSCGGPLCSKSGKILSPPNLPGWDDIPVTAWLEKAFGVPAFLQNDANACALAEWLLGAGKGSKDMLFLTMGTGFGCGIIAGGRLICGTNDLAGEAGHVRLEQNGPEGFGKAGSVEGFCSGAGIAKQMQAYTSRCIQEGKDLQWVKDGHPLSDCSAKLLAFYAQQGNADALFLFQVIGEKLGAAVALLLDLFNPDCIVIGSIFTRCEAFIRPSMETVIQKEALQSARTACKICAAQTGEQIGDFACILSACYALGILPVNIRPLQGGTKEAYARLFIRYPALSPLSARIQDAFYLLRQSFANGQKLLICGNGGSAADAGHIVGELMKGFFLPRTLTGTQQTCAARAFGKNATCNVPLQKALPAIALSAHSALSSAFINDIDPQYVFAQQVLGYGKKGDVLLAISTSGNSVNVVNAVKLARQLGMRTIALTGPAQSRLSALCDVTVPCPGENTAEIQEHHLPVYHTLCAMLEADFFK